MTHRRHLVGRWQRISHSEPCLTHPTRFEPIRAGFPIPMVRRAVVGNLRPFFALFSYITRHIFCANNVPAPSIIFSDLVSGEFFRSCSLSVFEDTPLFIGR
jgi:hypothetical protein